MAEEKSIGSEGTEGANASSPGSPGLTAHERPGVRIDQGPRNSITATFDRGQRQLCLQYKNPIEPEQFEAEEFGSAVTETLAWRSAWLRAISLAWSSDEFKRRLCENPYAFIHNYCGYAIPKNVTVVVVPDDHAAFSPGEDETNSWLWHLTRSVLVMYLPPRPEGQQGQDAIIALAAYDAVGSAYPFTACC